MSQMCCNQVRNIIAYINTREKFELSVLIVTTKCIIATQLISPIKLLRSIHMPFSKLYSLENLVRWKCLNKQNRQQQKLGKYATNIQMS